MTTNHPKVDVPALSAMSRAKYDALRDRANISTLKLFAKSAAHYRHTLDNPREDTDALRLGRVGHLAVLEPERFASEVAVWTGGRRAGKEWEAFRAANVGRELVNTDERDDAQALARAVRSDAAAAPYLAAGRAEVTVLWTDEPSGVECKGRLDWISTGDGFGAIVDLKTTKDASPEAFARQAWTNHYHAQAAFYQDAIYAARGQRLPFVVVAVEKEAPHIVQVYALPDEMIDAGRLAYRTWLRQLVECRESGKWPGYATGPVPLAMPRWADATGESADDEPESTTEEQ